MPETPSRSQDRLDSTQKKTRVGISDSPPIMFWDKSRNRPAGFAVEVLESVMATDQMAYEIELLPFASLLPALNAHDLDSAIISPSPERHKFAAYSRPFTRYGETLVVANSDQTAYETLSELAGKRVGSTANGGWAAEATRAGAILVPFKTVTDALSALQNGSIDAVLGNRPSYEYLLKSSAFPDLHIVKSYSPVLVNDLSFAFRKDDHARLALIDAALAKFMRTPQYRELARKWEFTRSKLDCLAPR